jgi:hypothetical protein
MSVETKTRTWLTWEELVLASPDISTANDRFNEQVAEFCGLDKEVPCMGWGWRETDFTLGEGDIPAWRRTIPIGRAGAYVGVMESNKWGYDSRAMMAAEAQHFRDLLDTVFVAVRDGDDDEVERLVVVLKEWFAGLRDVGEWRTDN